MSTQAEALNDKRLEFWTVISCEGHFKGTCVSPVSQVLKLEEVQECTLRRLRRHRCRRAQGVFFSTDGPMLNVGRGLPADTYGNRTAREGVRACHMLRDN